MLSVTFFANASSFASEPRAQQTMDNTVETASKIKAAYVYNFLKFIDWPENTRTAPPSSFRICLLGDDPIRVILGELSVRKARDRNIEVVQLHDSSHLSSCHVLYVGRSEELVLATVIGGLAGAPVLSVSDIPQFASKGGMIGFVTESDRIRIEINLQSARRAGLRVSAKLLEIARIVQ